MERWTILWCLLRNKRKYRLLVDQTQLWHLQSQSRTAWADLFKGPAFLAGAVLIETPLIRPGLSIVVWLWNRPAGFMCLNTCFQGSGTKSEGCRVLKGWGLQGGRTSLAVDHCSYSQPLVPALPSRLWSAMVWTAPIPCSSHHACPATMNRNLWNCEQEPVFLSPSCCWGAVWS